MIEIKYIRLDEKLNDKVSIYALSEYMSSIKNSTYGWIGGFQNNKLVYILPYIKKKKFIFNFIQFQSETIKLEKDKLEEEKEFLNEVVNFFEKEKIDFISCPSQNALFKVIPDSVFQIYSCKFGSYVINLKLSEDKIWEKIHGKHKNVIRKAIKNGLIVKLENHNYEEIYNIIETTMK